MSIKFIAIILISHFAAIGAGVYGGMKYAQSKSPRGRFSQTDFQSMQDLSPEERQQRLQELGANIGEFRGRPGGGGNRNGGGFIGGEIISKDDPAPEQARYGASKSVTIKLQDGGSKIVFLSDATEITKSSKGDLNDIVVGARVSVNGSQNSDGTVTAQAIQLRP